MSAIAQNNAQNNNAYITNRYDNDVAVIDTTTNTVVAAIPSVGNQPFGVAVSSDGSRVYITNVMSNDVAVIDAASNAIITSIPVGRGLGVAVTAERRQGVRGQRS